MQFTLALGFGLLLGLGILLVLIPMLMSRGKKMQHGGWKDPYEWIRPWKIVDFFRRFWLTR